MYALHNSGAYNFLYSVYVAGQNSIVNPRLDEFNLYYVPTCFFDAGYFVHNGMEQLADSARIVVSGRREVPQLELDVSVNWLGNAALEIEVTVVNKYYINYAPETPAAPVGEITGVTDHTYDFSTSVTDPESDQVYFQWDWGNGEISDWLGPFNSGEVAEGSHIWSSEGSYPIKVKARDVSEAEGPWSDVTDFLLSGDCGDANADGGINVGDAVFLGNHIFQSGDAPDPPERGDANCDFSVNVGDVVYLINLIFRSGPEPGCFPEEI